MPILIMLCNCFADVFKTYCWIHGTFTLPSQLTGQFSVFLDTEILDTVSYLLCHPALVAEM